MEKNLTYLSEESNETFVNGFIWTVMWVYYFIVFNPLMFSILTFFAPKKMFCYANECLHFNENNFLWSFIEWYGLNCSKRKKYWFNYYTKLQYATNQEQVEMLYNAKTKDFDELYSKHIDERVQRYYIWQSEEASEDLRLRMLKDRYQPLVNDFRFVLQANQCAVIKEIAKQTLSDEFVVNFWESAQKIDGTDVLSELVDYVVREGLTPRMELYVDNSQDGFAKNVVKKALEIHNNVAMLKRCKTKQLFRDLLNTGFKLTYEAQCILDVDMYKIFKELGNTLDERAVDFHLSKVGHMAKEILSENREFSVDDWKIIMKNKSLTSWCHNRC